MGPNGRFFISPVFAIIVFALITGTTCYLSHGSNGLHFMRARNSAKGFHVGPIEKNYKRPHHFQKRYPSPDEDNEDNGNYAVSLEGNDGADKSSVKLKKRDALARSFTTSKKAVRERRVTTTNAGIQPISGPYSKNGLMEGYEGPSENDGMEKKSTFRSWNEYTDTRKALIGRSASASTSSNGRQRTSGYVPVMNPDEHFRYMDKLFKAKNDRVRIFHDLYLFSKRRQETRA